MTNTQEDAPQDKAMREDVYTGIRTSLARGRFAPGEKLVLRQLAKEFEVSLTPVREALHRLIAEGVLSQEHSRSVRVPVLSAEKILELRDIRMLLECHAVEKAAERISLAEIKKLERLTKEIYAARAVGDAAVDAQKVIEFQFILYRASRMPVLLRHIEMLWLQTGPYIRLLYPAFVKHVQEVRPRWRYDMCEALRNHDSARARKIIEPDIYEALSYLSSLVGAASLIRND
jgi:DNA-binding GntR family transcriptional regulator